MINFNVNIVNYGNKKLLNNINVIINKKHLNLMLIKLYFNN